MQIQGASSNKKINDYTNSYEQYKQSAVENITLAEDLVIKDLFEDIPDVKFFFRSNLPAIDDIESEPEEFFNGTANTANYVRMTVPNNVIWSTICPEIKPFYVYTGNGKVEIDPTIEDEGKCEEGGFHHHSHDNEGYFPLKGLMKFNLAGADDEEDYQKQIMIVLPGELHTGIYKIVKGTIFLVEMLGGNNRVDKGRIIAISATQNANVEDAGIAIEIEEEEAEELTGEKITSSSSKSKGTSGKKTTKYTSAKESVNLMRVDNNGTIRKRMTR